MVFRYAREYKKEFSEVWTKTPFTDLMYDKITSRVEDEYQERFNDIWREMNETPVKK